MTPIAPVVQGASLVARIRRAARPVNILSRTITWALSIGAVVQGGLIIWGGPERWVGPGYTIVRQAPGSPYSWGVAILAFGLVAVVGSAIGQRWRCGFWVKFAGLGGMSAWCAAFAAAAAWTIYTVPTSGTTGLPSYLGQAVVMALMIFVDEYDQ